jgi:chromosome segregation ATPase
METNSATGTKAEPLKSAAELRSDLATVQEKLEECRAARKGGVPLDALLRQQRTEQELTQECNRITTLISRIENRNKEEMRVRRELADLQQQQHAINKEIERVLEARKASEDRAVEVEKKIKSLSRSRSVGELRVTEDKTLDAALNEASRLRTSIRLADEEILEWRKRLDAFTPGLQRLSTIIRDIEEKNELDRLNAVVNQRMCEREALERMVGEAIRAENNARGAFDIALGRIQERQFMANREKEFEIANRANKRRGIPQTLDYVAAS